MRHIAVLLAAAAVLAQSPGHLVFHPPVPIKASTGGDGGAGGIIPAVLFSLVVVNGNGSGNYAAGTVVPITADSPPVGQVFLAWTGTTVANPAASSTTVTMPSASVVVMATYTPITPPAACTGTANDFAIHIAPLYDGVGQFTPSGTPGTSFNDLQYGCPITRLTNGYSWFSLPVGHEYANMSAINQDNTVVLVGRSDGFWLFVDTHGNQITAPFSQATCPGGTCLWGGGQGGRWGYTDLLTMYYVNQNYLGKAVIPTDWASCRPTCTLTTSVVHTFSEYTTLGLSGGEGDMPDNDHISLTGISGSFRDVFYYNIATTTKSSVLHVDNTTTHFDNAQLLPSLKTVVNWGTAGGGHSGAELFDSSMAFLRQLTTYPGHSTAFAYGGSEYIAGIDGGSPPKCVQNGMVTINVNVGYSSATCIGNKFFQWGQSWHFSSSKDGSGWVGLSQVDYSAAQDSASYPLAPNYALPTNPVNNAPGGAFGYWGSSNNELMGYSMATGNIYRFAQHRSRPSASVYNKIPFGAISRDGRYIVFNSDYGAGASTPIADYRDAYLLDISSITHP